MVRAWHRLIDFPDILVMPVADYAACCGICLANPGVLAAGLAWHTLSVPKSMAIALLLAH